VGTLEFLDSEKNFHWHPIAVARGWTHSQTQFWSLAADIAHDCQRQTDQTDDNRKKHFRKNDGCKQTIVMV